MDINQAIAFSPLEGCKLADAVDDLSLQLDTLIGGSDIEACHTVADAILLKMLSLKLPKATYASVEEAFHSIKKAYT